MATIQITINGKNITSKLHKDDNTALAMALMTRNPDSAAWRTLASNAKVTGILSVLSPDFPVEVSQDEKARVNGVTIGKIIARLAVVQSFATWGWEVLTEKAEGKPAESLTDENEVLSLFA
jgi:hypothetical protein